jgi:hypothetical protein
MFHQVFDLQQFFSTSIQVTTVDENDQEESFMIVRFV